MWKKQGSQTLRREYTVLRNTLAILLKSAKKHFFRNLNTSAILENGSFDSHSVPTLIHDTGKTVSSKEKVEVLSEVFGKCFTSSVSPLGLADLDTFGNTAQQCPNELLCTVEQVEHLLGSLDVTKSPGPDGISAKMLKYVAQSIAPSVTRLVNQSNLTGVLCFVKCPT